MGDLVQLVGRRRGGVHAAELVALPEPRPRQDERHLLDELADRARPARLIRRPEPPPRELPVLLVGRASGERHVARQEAARGAPLQHQHLEPLLGVARDHGRRRLADLVVHERHPRTHPHHRHPRTAADGRGSLGLDRERPGGATRARGDRGPRPDRVRRVHGDRPVRPRRVLRDAARGRRRALRDQPARAPVRVRALRPRRAARCVVRARRARTAPRRRARRRGRHVRRCPVVRVRRAAGTATRLHRCRDQHRRTRRARRTRVRHGVRARRAGTVRGCGGRERGPRQPAVRPGPRPTRRPEGGPGGRAGRVARRDRGAVVERFGATPAARAGRGDDRAGRGVRAPARRSRRRSDAATSC